MRSVSRGPRAAKSESVRKQNMRTTKPAVSASPGIDEAAAFRRAPVPSGRVAAISPVFEYLGRLEPALVDDSGNYVAPDGHRYLSVKQASKRTGLSERELRRVWEATFGAVLQPSAQKVERAKKDR
jgi:hypothetical protein